MYLHEELSRKIISACYSTHNELGPGFLEKVYQRYHRIPWTILETERCVVRELSLDDLDALFELYGD